MSVEVRTLDDISEDVLAPVRNMPLVGVFYSAFLLKIWTHEYQWDDVVLSSGSAMLFGYVKKTSLGNIFYSLPFGWYGGVVGADATHEDAAAILGWLDKKSFLQENIVQVPAADALLEVYSDRYNRNELHTHLLDLQAEPEFSENIRRNIKRSHDSDFEITRCRKNELPRFLSLLHAQVSRTQERRRLPEHFYSELFLQGCRDGGEVVAVGAAIDGKLCAVHLYFRSRSDIFYFDGVASDKGKELLANFAIFEHVISRNREEGLLRFNFGATPSGDAGLERFKAGWGATKHTYYEFSRRSLLKQGVDFVVRR